MNDQAGKPEKTSKPEKIRFDGEKTREYNRYYANVATGYKVSKFVLLAVLLCYLIVSMSIYRSYITYDNLMYLLRDFDTDAASAAAGFSDISYDDDGDMRFDIYKDRLALVTNTSLTLYNTAGATELKSTGTGNSPALLTGDKYAMVYDVGGTSYYLYNTVARVLSKTTEGRIQSAALSDSGTYLLVTRARENRYLISIYDDSFRELTRIYKDKFVIDAALDRSGTKYAVVSFEVNSADFVCEVMSGKCSSDESNSVSVAGYLPLSVNYFSNGSFAVVCDAGVLFFSSDGQMTSEYKFSGKDLVFADFCGDRILVSVSENIVASRSRLILLAPSGQVEKEIQVDGKISAAAVGNKNIFYVCSGELTSVSPDGSSTTTDCPPDVRALVPYLDDVVVCTGTSASMGFGVGEDNSSSDTVESPASEADTPES